MLLPGGRIVTTEGLEFYVRDDALGRSIAKYRTRPEIALVQRAQELTGASGTFLDVGANIGTSAVAAVKLAGFTDVVCIEPEPANVALLEVNLDLNGVPGRVVQAAAYSSEGKGKLYLKRSNSGANFLDFKSKKTGLMVPLVTLDQLEVRPGLIWIDAQGAEGHILAGAGSLVGTCPIVLEFYPKGLDATGGKSEIVNAATRYEHVIDLRSGAPVDVARLRVEGDTDILFF